MLRANMTVVTKTSRYAANHIAVTRRRGTWESDLTFISSGEVVSVPAEDVVNIEFRPTGGVHCDACDQRVDTPADYLPKAEA